MADSPIRPLPNDGISKTREVSRSETRQTNSGDGAAFRALLETLQSQASEVRASSEEDLSRPAELSGAVDLAEESLRSALDLKDQLLEAYRQAIHQDDTSAGSPE